jgi:hypothetical protein
MIFDGKPPLDQKKPEDKAYLDEFTDTYEAWFKASEICHSLLNCIIIVTKLDAPDIEKNYLISTFQTIRETYIEIRDLHAGFMLTMARSRFGHLTEEELKKLIFPPKIPSS